MPPRPRPPGDPAPPPSKRTKPPSAHPDDDGDDAAVAPKKRRRPQADAASIPADPSGGPKRGKGGDKAEGRAARSSDTPPAKSAKGDSPKKTRKKGRARRGSRGGWVRVLALEGSLLALGVAIGATGAGYALWRQAEDDVAAWLAGPARAEPAVVLSAPIHLEVGQPLDPEAFAEDLLAAGYQRVQRVDGADQFAIGLAGLDVWTSEGHPGTVPGRACLTLVDGRIAATRPDRVVLRPTVLARLGDLQDARTPVQLAALSPWVEKSVLAMEDARFRDHHGVDPIGVARALWVALRGEGRAQGGSTLTQQLAKNLFLSQERTARRKLREVFFAAALENRLTKDQILELYLGEIYLGQVGSVPVHGVEQAARAWFGVSASRLTLAQAATLAGVISAPNAYSPVRHPEVALERRDLALQRMADLGWATPHAIAEAKAEPLVLRGLVTGPARRAPWAVDAAVEVAEASLGAGELGRGGYRVTTTIQPHLQVAAERAVAEGLAEIAAETPKATSAQAALVAVRADDGAVVALVGSRAYRESPFDRASDAWRAMGSTVKPLTLIAAFDANPELHPASTVVDEPISRRIDGKAWTPGNADGLFRGAITLRTALEQSRNIPAIKLAEEVGPTRLQAFLRDAGLTRATHLPSAALGAFSATPLQIAGAYTVFPGGGRIATPRVVSRIDGADGSAIVRFQPDVQPIASARAAAQATRMLQGVLTDGTGRRAGSYGVGGAVGGKTGTTDDGRDAWVAGVTPGYAVVAWVGNDQGSPLGLTGSKAALPVWARLVADGGLQGGAFPKPEGLKDVPICRESGKPARDACPVTVPDLFTPAQEPRGSCDVHGGPVVEAGRWLRDLFGVRRREDVVGSPP